MSKKYNKKNNMKQAMYEMFGVGENQPMELVVEEPVVEQEMEEYEPTTVNVPVTSAMEMKTSFLAQGTVFEGTLKTNGNVEIAGGFNGDVFAEGKVVLSSAVRGNVSGSDLNLVGCTLTGDIKAKGSVIIGEDSLVCGNISAEEVRCAGKITGDLEVSGDTALEDTAVINGVIKTKTMSMAKGAVIKGGIEMSANK